MGIKVISLPVWVLIFIVDYTSINIYTYIPNFLKFFLQSQSVNNNKSSIMHSNVRNKTKFLLFLQMPSISKSTFSSFKPSSLVNVSIIS